MAIARNDNDIVFVNIGGVPADLGIWSASSGGSLIGSGTPTFTPAPAVGDTVTFVANSIELEVPNGDLENFGSDRAVDGIINSTVYVSLHSAHPTLSNQITADGADRKFILTSAWTVSAN